MLASYAVDKTGSEIAMDKLVPASPSPKKDQLSPMHGLSNATIHGLVQLAHPYRHVAKFLETVVPSGNESSSLSPSQQSNSRNGSHNGSRTGSPVFSSHLGTGAETGLGVGGTISSSSVVVPRVENSLESGSASLEASITESGNYSAELQQQQQQQQYQQQQQQYQQQQQQQQRQQSNKGSTARNISFQDHPSSPGSIREINDDDSVHSQNTTQNFDTDFVDTEGGRGQVMDDGQGLGYSQQQQYQQQQGLGLESQEYLSLSQIAHKRISSGREELVLPASTAAALANRANYNNGNIPRIGGCPRTPPVDAASNTPC